MEGGGRNGGDEGGREGGREEGRRGQGRLGLGPVTRMF